MTKNQHVWGSQRGSLQEKCRVHYTEAKKQGQSSLSAARDEAAHGRRRTRRRTTAPTISSLHSPPHEVREGCPIGRGLRSLEYSPRQEAGSKMGSAGASPFSTRVTPF